MKLDAQVTITAHTAFGDVTNYYYSDELEFVFELIKKYVKSSVNFTITGM